MDKIISCCDCSAEFTWTEKEQEFYNSRTPPLHAPRRCKECREKRKAARGNR